MVEISAKQVKELRDITGISMMKCKKALIDAGGDVDAAVELLRKQGLKTAEKKKDREVKDGKVGIFSKDGNYSMVELSCETDFVARNEDFNKLLQEIGETLLEKGGQEDFSGMVLKDSGKKLEDAVKDAIAHIGENIQFRRGDVLDGPVVGSYLHHNSKIGVLVELSGDPAAAEKEEVQEMVKDICQHIAFTSPLCMTSEEVPKEELNKEKEIFRDQVKGKPDDIVEKILQGKLQKYFKEVCLAEQAFIKDDKKSIKQLVQEVADKTGADLALSRFLRYEVGK
mgnify:CR=1 FL=1